MMNRPRKVTSRQVASLAGVSQTTVSFVLNNVESAGISEETRQRVMEAARTLNYVPVTAAQALVRGRSSTIALVLARPHRQIFIDEFLPKILTGISEVTQQHGFRVMVELVGAEQLSAVYSGLLRSKEAAGVITTMGATNATELQPILGCAAAGLPLVALNYLHPEVYSVEVDRLAGVKAIVEHLIALGHRRIACIPYADSRSNPYLAKRLDIYRATLAAAGIAIDDALIHPGDYDPETGYRAALTLLDQQPRPTAIFAMNDVMAFGALRAIRERGGRVPEDVAVVGFDDVRLAAFSDPPLTTINEPDIEQGRRAAEMLLTLIHGAVPETRHVALATQLIVRQSCGASS